MIDEKLVSYIKQNMERGYKPDKIREGLAQYGYDPANIEDSMRAATGSTPATRGAAMATNVEYCGFWYRVSAAIWDSIIIYLPIGIVFTILSVVMQNNNISYIGSLLGAIIVIYLEGEKGTTPGKRILGLRVVNEKNENIGIPMAILRYIGKIISGLILGIGYFMIGGDAKKQGLHDKIAQSFVIKQPGVNRKGLMITGIILGVLFLILIPILLIAAALTYFASLAPTAFMPPA